MRERIQDHIENAQTSDSYEIGTANLHWIGGRAEYLLILKDGTHEYESGGCGHSISLISDEDIVNYYHEELADWYEETV
jgi:hypothetical protein